MKTFVKENDFLGKRSILFDFGWGNGYVVIPVGNRLNGMSYDQLNEIGIDVHYGLTFSEKVSDLDWEEVEGLNPNDWVVGFDTAHLNDTLEKWSKKQVEEETERLKEQLIIKSL